MSVVLAGLGQGDFFTRSPTAQADHNKATARDSPNDPLPAAAIVRLGTPQIRSNNLGSFSITFLPDGRTTVSTGPDQKVVFWDATTGKPIRSLAGHLYVALSPDGKVFASKGDFKDRTVRLFEVATGKEIGQIAASHHSTRFAFSPDGRRLAVGGGQLIPPVEDQPLRVWDVPACKDAQRFLLLREVNSLAFSPDGKTLATAILRQKPSLQLWEVATGKELRGFDSARDAFSPSSLSFSRDGAFLAVVGNGIHLWDLHTVKERWSIYTGDPTIGNLSIDWASSVAFSPNGKTIAVGASRAGAGPIRDGTRSSIYLFEAASGRKRAEFDGGANVLSVAFSPCGLMLGSVGSDGAPLIWDVTGQVLAAKKAPAAFSENDLEACWNDLSGGGAFKTGWVDMRGQDAAKAWQAICALTIRPEKAVPFLKKRLPAKPRLEPKQQARLQDDLENGDVATRERAVKELAEIGPPALPFLRKLAGSGINADAKQRLEKLLGEQGKAGLLTEEARCRYAIEVLEYLGTPQAKEILEAQAQGEPASPLTQDAIAALTRLRKLPASR